MQLQQSLDEYKKRGLGVAAISYDIREILQDFAERAKITYPLLSDDNSATIRAFGILNNQVPSNSPQYGIPNPGMYIVDANGKIVSRFFEQDYRERFTPDTILIRHFGAAAGRRVEIKTEHLTLTVGQSQTLARGGNRVTLIADFVLPPKMHVYAPGVEGYRPVAFTINENPDVTIHPAHFPKSEVLYLPAIKERVPVYKGKLRVTRDVTVSSATRLTTIELKGAIEYQACDDKICFLPKRVPVTFGIDVEAHDRQRVPANLQRKPPG